MEFTFYTANKIVFKQNAIEEVGVNVKGLGKKFLIVVDPFFADSKAMKSVKKQLEDIGASFSVFSDVTGEPTVDMVDEVDFEAVKN